jgi:hypothetical protein
MPIGMSAERGSIPSNARAKPVRDVVRDRLPEQLLALGAGHVQPDPRVPEERREAP